MADNLNLALEANQTYEDYGYDYVTRETFDLATGAACSTNGACIMNGNTAVGTGDYADYWYYSWYAATAGTGTDSTGVGEDPQGSICPKGWRLPANYTVDPDKSYGSITLKYLGFVTNVQTSTGYKILEAIPLSYPRTGFYNGGTLGGAGVYGHHWSSTASTIYNAYNLYHHANYVYPQNTNVKYYGYPIRCVVI